MKVISLVRLLRPLYWSKNLLLFLPLLLCDKAYIPQQLWSDGIYGFLLFSLAASTGYIFNDIIDRSNDRLSLRRNGRGLANASISLSAAVGLLIGLLVAQGLLWAETPFYLNAVLWIYLLTSGLYSLFFKNVRWFDIFHLAFFHLLRIHFGILLFKLPPSPWLMSFSFFAFLALGSLKRLDELVGDAEHGRPYRANESKILNGLVIGSAVVMTGILTAYILDGPGLKLYRTPLLLFLLIPIIALWLGSWLKAARSGHICDPILFFFSQRMTYAFVAGALLILRGAS